MRGSFLCIPLFAIVFGVMGCHRHVQANAGNAWSDGAVIEAVQIAGNRQIDTPTISAIIQTKTGNKIDSTIIRRDIGSLRSLGFEEVKVKEEKGSKGGKVITFDVKEKRSRMKRMVPLP